VRPALLAWRLDAAVRGDALLFGGSEDRLRACVSSCGGL